MRFPVFKTDELCLFSIYFCFPWGRLSSLCSNSSLLWQHCVQIKLWGFLVSLLFSLSCIFSLCFASILLNHSFSSITDYVASLRYSLIFKGRWIQTANTECSYTCNQEITRSWKAIGAGKGVYIFKYIKTTQGWQEVEIISEFLVCCFGNRESKETSSVCKVKN